MSLSVEPGQWIDSEEERERLRIAREVVDSLRTMTPEEGFQSMVRTGIYTQDGRLRKEYGGDA